MAHVAKHTKAATGHLCAHFDRGANSIGNENINPELTKYNYNLGPTRDISQGDFIRKRCGEVQCMNRKDVKVMCSWVVTVPKNLASADHHRFFLETYKFLINRYGGEKNVVSSFVHMDEITPHMHFAFVPVVADRRKGVDKVSAKECISRSDLKTFHTDLEKHLATCFGRELGVLNGATKDGNKSIEELKRGQASKDIRDARKKFAAIQSNIKQLRSVEVSLQSKIQMQKGQILMQKEFDAIQPEKTLTGALRGISLEDVQNLKKMAIQYFEIKAEYEKLKREYAKAQKAIPTMEERLFQVQIKKENQTLQAKLQAAYDLIERIPEDIRLKLYTEIEREQSPRREYDFGIKL